MGLVSRVDIVTKTSQHTARSTPLATAMNIVRAVWRGGCMTPRKKLRAAFAANARRQPRRALA